MAVEPVDRLAALLGQFITAVGQQPQHRGLPVADDLAQVPGAMRRSRRRSARRAGPSCGRDRCAAGGPATPGVDGTSTTVSAGSDELLRQQPSEPVAALDRPAPGRPCGGPAEQRRGHRRGGDHLEVAELLPVLVDRDRGVGALVWIDADGDQRCLLCPVHAGHGEQPEFRDDQASIELRRVRARAGGQAMREPHRPRWARSREPAGRALRSPNHESWRGALWTSKQVRSSAQAPLPDITSGSQRPGGAPYPEEAATSALRKDRPS